MKDKIQILHLSLVTKHVNDSIEALNGRECLRILRELLYRKRFGILEVVDEQDDQTDLIYYYLNNFAAGFLNDRLL